MKRRDLLKLGLLSPLMINFGLDRRATLNLGVAVTGFRPIDLSGLVRWGKADALVGLVDGDPVSSFTDQSAGAHHFTSTTTLRPLWKTAIQNSLAMLKFDGSNDDMRCDALAATLTGSNTPFTFFLVFKHVATGAGSQAYFMLADIGTTGVPTHDIYYRGFSGNWWCDRRDDSATINRIQGGTPDTNAHTLIYSFDGTTGNLYIDDSLVGSGSQVAAALSATCLTYGSHRRFGENNEYFNGYWGEDGIYSRALNVTEIGQVQSYLAGRWGTTKLFGDGAVGTPAWEPYQLGTALKAWARDDSWNFIANNAAATTWYSKVYASTTGPDFTGTGTFKTAILNSRDAVQLNGSSNDFASNILAAYVTGTDMPFTVFGAFQATSNAAVNELFSFGPSIGATPIHRLRLNSGGGSAYRVDRRDNAGGLVTQTGGTVDTSKHTFICIFDGSSVTLYVDGSVVISALSLLTGLMTVNQGGIGTFFQGGSFSEWFTGYFGEVGFMDTAISGSDLTSLLSYLAGRW